MNNYIYTEEYGFELSTVYKNFYRLDDSTEVSNLHHFLDIYPEKKRQEIISDIMNYNIALRDIIVQVFTEKYNITLKAIRSIDGKEFIVFVKKPYFAYSEAEKNLSRQELKDIVGKEIKTLTGKMVMVKYFSIIQEYEFVEEPY